MSKRKVEKNPNTEQPPTKIGRFIVEPGYEFESDPNFNQLTRLRAAADKESFHNFGDDLLRSYLDTSEMRFRTQNSPDL